MNDIVSRYLEQFVAAGPDAGAAPPWLREQRDAAMAQLRKHGFPGPRDEDWRYTPLKPLAGKAWETAATGAADIGGIDDRLIAGLDSHRLVFIDGVFSSDLSTTALAQEGISVRPLSVVLREDAGALPDTIRGGIDARDGFQALNIAFARDGYVVDIASDSKPDKTLECLFIAATAGKAGQTRNVVRLGEHASASLVERHVSLDGVDALVNCGSRLLLGAGSSLDYHLVQTMDSGVNMISDTEADLGADATLRILTATLGGAVVRNNLQVRLNAPGGHCDMLGLYAATGRQHVDNHTGVIHVAPHCTSRELYKGVLDQRARGVFHGRIRVDRGAQKTDATQANNNLLLSANAEIDTKPQLEIYADDVKCAHGATVGQLDETALFYLRSRGISADDARSLLTFAFVNEVLSEIGVDALAEYLGEGLARRLIQHG